MIHTPLPSPAPPTIASDQLTHLVADLSPWVFSAYLLLRLIIPAVLILVATRGATRAEKISLVRDYLLS